MPIPTPSNSLRRLWPDLLRITAFSIVVSNVLCWLFVVQIGGQAMGPIVYLPATLVPAMIAPFVTWRIFRLVHALERAQAELRHVASTDNLTGLQNRGSFTDTLGRDMARAARTGGPLVLMMLDLDHFKHVNDEHGHPVGDALLQGIAGVLRGTLRDVDPVGRWGGEEFIVGLDACSLDDACEAAERVRRAIEGFGLPLANGAELHASASIGVAAWAGPGESFDALVRRVDDAMYTAKRAGRNRVVVDAGAGRCAAADDEADILGAAPTPARWPVLT
ncbi:GGDEF domain-containing protein [Ideonella sp. A 288]|uniref:GGDEF domain-containing protein n=1 Tax=Ideonella sp. A 288 TaxID=1962181 RepID=UPI00130319BC|nr:GGDEF domain-containing protein [Ideonella sp. A 288]